MPLDPFFTAQMCNRIIKIQPCKALLASGSRAAALAGA